MKEMTDILLSVANLYGAYLGEVLLRCGLKDLDFTWTDNGECEIGVGKKDFWMASFSKVYRRITEGPEHDLMYFFEVVFGLAVGAVSLTDPRVCILNEDAV